MAPCSMMSLEKQQQQQTTTGLRKLRKPVIEKMRRDRINSSIEQLRLLLEKDLQAQQLPPRAEKADILELAVTFLQQHMAGRGITASSQAHGEGYSSCVRDSVDFLSAKKCQGQVMRQITGQPASYTVSPAATTFVPVSGPVRDSKSKSLWRPW